MPQDDDEYQKGSLRQKIIQMLSCCCKSRFAQLFERGIDSLMDQSGLADEILFLSPDPLSPAAIPFFLLPIICLALKYAA